MLASELLPQCDRPATAHTLTHVYVMQPGGVAADNHLQNVAADVQNNGAAAQVGTRLYPD